VYGPELNKRCRPYLRRIVMQTKERGRRMSGAQGISGDFSRWEDHKSYRKAFERLLRELKAETKT
jgi:hypothetical protein